MNQCEKLIEIEILSVSNNKLQNLFSHSSVVESNGIFIDDTTTNHSSASNYNN